MARFDWLGSSDKYFVSHFRAAGRGQFAGFRVDPGRHDAAWHREFMHVPILRMLVRSLHEFGPNRQCAARSLEFNVAIVVEADPNHADQLGGETGEPTVVRGAGLAGRWQNESARPHPRTRTGV